MYIKNRTNNQRGEINMTSTVLENILAEKLETELGFNALGNQRYRKDGVTLNTTNIGEFLLGGGKTIEGTLTHQVTPISAGFCIDQMDEEVTGGFGVVLVTKMIDGGLELELKELYAGTHGEDRTYEYAEAYDNKGNMKPTYADLELLKETDDYEESTTGFKAVYPELLDRAEKGAQEIVHFIEKRIA